MSLSSLRGLFESRLPRLPRLSRCVEVKRSRRWRVLVVGLVDRPLWVILRRSSRLLDLGAIAVRAFLAEGGANGIISMSSLASSNETVAA